MSARRIAVLGDSILRGVVLDDATGRYVRLQPGCVGLAQASLGCQVDNFARFGMTSEKGLELAAKLLHQDGGYDTCLICFGGNDVDHQWQQVAQNPQGENPPNVPCHRYAQNMKQMVELARGHGMEPLVLTLPPIDSQRYFSFFTREIPKRNNILQWLGSVEAIHESHAQYSRQLIALAKELDVRIIDIRKQFIGTGEYQQLLCADGIHPNARGHRLMGQELIRQLNSHTVH